jgi:beta-mannanase
MIQVLFHYMPKYVFGYTFKQAIQFLFAQTWYTFWSTSMAVLFILPCIALLTNTPISTMPFVEFIIRYLPVWGMTLITWFWTKKWFQPREISLSWRGIVLHIARWPVVLYALVNVILGVKKPYMITTKGMEFGETRTFSLKSQIPYFSLIAISLLSIFSFYFQESRGQVQGYLVFALEGLIMYTVLYSVVLVNEIKRLRTEKVKIARSFGLRARHLLILLGLLFSIGLTTTISITPIVQAVTWTPLSVVELPASLAIEASAVIQDSADLPISTPKQVINVETPILSEKNTTPVVLTEATKTASPLPAPLSNMLAFGAYDPEGSLDGLLQIEHSFVVWFLPEDLTKAVESARRSQCFPLISLEPWPLLINNLTAESLLEDINNGKYDDYIYKDAKVIKSQSPQEVLIRWGHEMELSGLYPWSQNDPEIYISAYRRVVDIFRKEGVENVCWIWSPGGNSNAEEFYPGDSYVDYVGVTILADERWDKEAGFDPVRSFKTLLSEKYRLTEEFNKPLIVAEVGISMVDVSKKKLWLKNAMSSFSDFPKLTAFVYFNFVNTHSVDNYKPEWGVDRQMFKEVLEGRESFLTVPKLVFTPTLVPTEILPTKTLAGPTLTKEPTITPSPSLAINTPTVVIAKPTPTTLVNRPKEVLPTLTPTLSPPSKTPVSSETYVVKEGDNLLLLAQKFYGNGEKWRIIYEANLGIIKNPNRVYPGQILTIPR